MIMINTRNQLKGGECMSDETAVHVLPQILLILNIYGLLEPQQKWVPSADKTDDDLIVAYINDNNEQERIDIVEIEDGYSFSYWNDQAHMGEFITSQGGILREFIQSKGA